MSDSDSRYPKNDNRASVENRNDHRRRTSDPDAAGADVLRRMLERERRARRDAEKFLEIKSRELYEANRSLESALAAYRRDAFYLSSILDSATDGIITINAEGQVEKANPSACRILGTTLSALEGTSASQWVPRDILGQIPSAENNFLSDLCTAKEPMLEAFGKRSDGTPLELELSASFGEIDGIYVVTWVMRDISFIRSVQRQAALSQRLAGIGELAAGIAHEINTPVQFVNENTKFLAEAFQAMERVLDCYEQLTANDPAVTTKAEEACPSKKLRFYRDEAPYAFQETTAGANRIAKIVSAVKEFSHPGTEEKLSVDLNQAVESARTVTANHWKEIALLELRLEDNLPIIPAFPAQINQVLVNLIVNAADAIAETTAGELGKIEIETGRDGDRVSISIKDSGSGITEENLDRVFLPFFTTKPVGKGTGQGLSITHSIVVDNHGGSIAVASQPGEGTQFKIHLPIHPA